MADFVYNEESKVIFRKDDFTFPIGGLGHLIWKAMIANGNAVAQIDAQTGEQDTYHTLLHKAIKTAIHLKKLGIKSGDIISICSHNHLNSCVPFLAAQILGIVVAPTDPTIAPEDIHYLLRLVQPIVMFISETCESWIEDVTADMNDLTIVSFGDCNRFINFDEFLEEEFDEAFEPIFLEDGKKDAVIMFSSGTTGLPKGICLSHDFIVFNCHNLYLTHSDYKVYLSYASVYWISSVLNITSSIFENSCRLLCCEFDPNLFWEYIEKYKVNSALLPPTQAIRCLKTLPEHFIPSTFKTLLIGGSAISPSYVDKIRAALPSVTLLMGYGLTEMGICTCSSTSDSMHKVKLYTIGLPLGNIQLRLVDPDTEKPLGFNEVGELRVKSLCPMNGYYKQDSSQCFDGDGFMKTGDMVYYDEDFNFYFTDRIKEMFKYLSWHIVPAKLEAILERHPDVQLAVVLGAPHQEDDNHALGVVVLHEYATSTASELRKFVDGLVDERNWLRGGVRIVKSVPLTPSGKIMRRKLRDMILDGTL